MKITREQFCTGNIPVDKYRYGPIIFMGHLTIQTLSKQQAKDFNVQHLCLSPIPVDPTTQPTKIDWLRCGKLPGDKGA